MNKTSRYWPGKSRGFSPRADRWTLAELLVAVFLVAIAAKLTTTGNTAMALCGLTFVLGVRVAVLDYSIVGNVAVGTVMAAGICLVFLASFWCLE